MKTLKSARLSLSASSTKGKKRAKSSVKAGKKMAKVNEVAHLFSAICLAAILIQNGKM